MLRIGQECNLDLHRGIAAVQGSRVDPLGEPRKVDGHHLDGTAEVVFLDASDEYAAVERESCQVLRHLAFCGVGQLVVALQLDVVVLGDPVGIDIRDNVGIGGWCPHVSTHDP